MKGKWKCGSGKDKHESYCFDCLDSKKEGFAVWLAVMPREYVPPLSFPTFFYSFSGQLLCLWCLSWIWGRPLWLCTFCHRCLPYLILCNQHNSSWLALTPWASIHESDDIFEKQIFSEIIGVPKYSMYNFLWKMLWNPWCRKESNTGWIEDLLCPTRTIVWEKY